MEGKRNRGEVTAELSEKVWARLCRENALVASEVWVDDARRVDFVGFAGGFGRGDRVGHGPPLYWNWHTQQL